MPENSYTHFFQFARKIERGSGREVFVLVVYINLLGKAKVLQYLKLAKVSYAGSVHAIMVQEEPYPFALCLYLLQTIPFIFVQY